MIKNFNISNSPVVGYFFQGIYYLTVLFLIKINILTFKVSDFALLIFYTSVLSQIINLGNNLSISYFLTKEIKKNFAPFFLSSLVILIGCTFIFSIFSFILNFDKSPNFNYLIIFSFFISLNKIITSILLSLQQYQSYSFVSIIKLIIFFIIVLLTKDIYSVLIYVEILFSLIQIFIIHIYLNYYYFFNLKNFFEFLNHGFRVFWGNLFYDLLFKMDLIIFNMYLPKNNIEELSFSILIFEYFYQIIYVIRISIFPRITELFYYRKDSKNFIFKTFLESLKKLRLKYLSILVIFSCLSSLILFFLNQFDYISNITFLNTFFLIFGVVLANFGHLYQLVFNQIGYPLVQSFYFIFSTILIIILYRVHIYFFSSNYIYITSLLSVLIIGFNINLFLKFIQIYEPNRVTTKRILQ
jgi:hypothetical protein